MLPEQALRDLDQMQDEHYDISVRILELRRKIAAGRVPLAVIDKLVWLEALAFAYLDRTQALMPVAVQFSKETIKVWTQ